MQTIIDNEGRVLTIDDVTIVEGTDGTTQGLVAVTMRASTDQTTPTAFGVDISFDYTIVDGTADSPQDYTSTGGTATIEAGDVSVDLMVPIVADDIDEIDETFTVTISNAVGSVLVEVSGTRNAGVVTIEDDDGPPAIRVMDASVTEGGTAAITVMLMGCSSGSVSVDYMTENGTATASSDYTAVPTATLNWPDEDSQLDAMTFNVVTIETLDNGQPVEEDAETVIIRLSNAVSDGPEGVTLLNPDGTSAPGITTAAADGTLLTPLLDPQDVPKILREMHLLGGVRSKPTTGIALGRVGQSQADITVTAGTLTATLDVVGERTNRNFFLTEGINFTGLALVPDDQSDTFAEVLAQSAPNVNKQVRDFLKGKNPDSTDLNRDVVKLAHVVETVFADYNFNGQGGFKMFTTPAPDEDGTSGGSLTTLDPFQGMLIRTRDSVDSAPGSIFQMADVDGFTDPVPVPVKMTVWGRFGGDADAPVRALLQNGFNLLAPHVWADTPFEAVFGGTGEEPEVRFQPALAFKREVMARESGDVIDAMVDEGHWVTEYVDGGIIEPELAYWVQHGWDHWSGVPSSIGSEFGVDGVRLLVACSTETTGWQPGCHGFAYDGYFGPPLMLLGCFEVEGSGRAEFC
jgi:hypothetical protein